jgi:hypothetical protein
MDDKAHSATVQRRFVSESVISETTGRRMQTLQRDRMTGRGPFPYYKIGKQVRYDIDEVFAIVEASRVAS